MAPLSGSNARLSRIERFLIHESLRDVPHERIVRRLDVEPKTPRFSVYDFDMSRKVMEDNSNLIAVCTEEKPIDSYGAHATSSGVIWASCSATRSSVSSSS